MLQQHTAGAALTSGHVPPGSSRSWSMMYDRRVVTLWWRLIGHYKIETHKDHDMPSLPPSHTLSDWQTTHNGHLLTVTVLFTWLIDWLSDWQSPTHWCPLILQASIRRIVRSRCDWCPRTCSSVSADWLSELTTWRRTVECWSRKTFKCVKFFSVELIITTNSFVTTVITLATFDRASCNRDDSTDCAWLCRLNISCKPTNQLLLEYYYHVHYAV